MKRIIITLLLLTNISNAELYERILIHLERFDITNGVELYSSGKIQTALFPEDGSTRITLWENVPIPEPKLIELIEDSVATQLISTPLKYRRKIPVYPYFELLTDAEKLAVDQVEEAAKQSTKSDALKNAERRVITFLKTEGFIGADDKKFTAEQILAMHATLDLLPDQDVADAKRAKYDSLIRRVETAGGTEFDVYEHPTP